MRIPRLKILLLGALTWFGVGADAPPPNVVLLLVDDLGWQDVSVPMGPRPTPSNERYRTPWLERLAANGIVFSDAYAASPVCTPTRVSILTGRHPARTGVTYWILHPDRDTSSRHERLSPPVWNVSGLQTSDGTLPRLLADAGYRTIHVGKAHFGAVGTPGADPTNVGFDVNVAGHAAGAPGSYLGVHGFAARGRREDDRPSVWDVPGLETVHGSDVYLTDVLAQRADEEIRAAVAAGSPFFLHFAPYAVHTPIMPHPERVGRYRELEPTEAAYASMIETVDAALGRIMTTLEELDLADETLIVFASDNGGLSAHGRGGDAHTHNAPLRSGKGSAYEGGVRIPFVIRPPGDRSEVGPSRIATPIVTTDLFATILGVAGIQLDAADHDSIDLAPFWTTGRPRPDRPPLFWHMPHQWGVPGPGIEPFSSLRMGRWKIIYFHDGPRVELYDLERDPGETTDLSTTRPAVRRRLAELLDRALEDADARLSIATATGRPVPRPASTAVDESSSDRSVR